MRGFRQRLGLDAPQHVDHRAGVELVLAAFGLPVDGDDPRQRSRQRRKQRRLHRLGVTRVAGEAPKRLAQLKELRRV